MVEHGGTADTGTANGPAQNESEAAAVKKKPSANPITPGQVSGPEQGKHALGMFPATPFRITVFVLGIILLTIAIALKFTQYQGPRVPQLQCFTGPRLTYNGLPIDFCNIRTDAAGGTQCGAPAADAFCTLRGSVYSYNWTQSIFLVNSTIALGNNAFGGQQTFSEICCDNKSYWPIPPRWILWVSGILLLYLVSVAVTKLFLLAIEVVLVGLVATEALYFFSGFEPLLNQVLYFVGLVIWTNQTFRHIWCNPDFTRECEDKWLSTPQTLQDVLKCLMAYQIGRLLARLLGRGFGWAYFFRNQLPQVRKVLNQERYLSAMSTPQWARALIRAREEAIAEAASVEARGDHPAVVGGVAPGIQDRLPQFHGGSVLQYLKKDKEMFNGMPKPAKSMFEKLFGPGGFLSCCRGAAVCTGRACVCCRHGCHASRADSSEVPEPDSPRSSTGHKHKRHELDNEPAGVMHHGDSPTSHDHKSSRVMLPMPPATNAVLNGVAPIGPAQTTIPETRPAVPEMEMGSIVAPRASLDNHIVSPFADAEHDEYHSRHNEFATPHPLLRSRASTRASLAHHSRLAGNLEPGTRSEGDLATKHDVVRSIYWEGDHNEYGTSAPDKLNEAGMHRRITPRNSHQNLHRMSIEHERLEAQAHDDMVKRVAAELNADLVAVDVGGVGALRKFTAFLQKYQTMTDDQMEIETTSLARRLFQNLKAYLNPGGQLAVEQSDGSIIHLHAYGHGRVAGVQGSGVSFTSQAGGGGHGHGYVDRGVHSQYHQGDSVNIFGQRDAHGLDGNLRAIPSGTLSQGSNHRRQFMRLFVRENATEHRPMSLGRLVHFRSRDTISGMDTTTAKLPPAGGANNHGTERRGMTQSSSSPNLKQQDSNGSAPEPESIHFRDFVHALRRARRSSMSLSRTSTGSLVATAREAWNMFDKQHASKLTEEDVKATLQEVYKSRRNLALSIRANQAVCRSLEAATGFVIQTALVFVYLAIFGLVVAFSSGLDYFKTYVVAFSFIFGESVKNLFQNAIYLFAEHPFDVGDVIRYNDSDWVVDSFDLMFTVLCSIGGEWTTLPNTLLMNSQLVNLNRSRSRLGIFKIKVPANMPMTVVAKIKENMLKVYENNRCEYEEKSINALIVDMVDSQTMTLQTIWRYTFPPSEVGRMWNAMTAMQEAIIRTLVDEGVSGIPIELGFTALKIKNE